MLGSRDKVATTHDIVHFRSKDKKGHKGNPDHCRTSYHEKFGSADNRYMILYGFPAWHFSLIIDCIRHFEFQHVYDKMSKAGLG